MDLMAKDVVRKIWSKVERKLLAGKWSFHESDNVVLVWSGVSYFALGDECGVVHHIDKEMKVCIPDHIRDIVRQIKNS